jgi:DNA-binding transcriptional regulator PaaX
MDKERKRYKRINKEAYKEGYTERLKNFLDSDTRGAKIATVALCVFTLASLPVVMLGASAMGNAVQMFKIFEGSKKYSRKQIRNVVNSAKHQKLIEYVREKDGKTMVKITKKGKAKLRAFDIELIEIKKPKNWDGKWRLAMFDIPMRHTNGRESLRYHLKNLGFFQFQKSAWIYPYPCEDEIIFVADFFGVERYLEILTVESITRDKKLKKYFDL